MKSIIMLLSVLIIFMTNPIKKGAKDIKLNKKYKVENTFSGNTSGEDSFHFIIVAVNYL